MKRVLLIILFLSAKNLLSQTIVVKDKILNTPIDKINFTFQEKGIVSNKNGVVDLSVFNNKDLIKISHISYKTEKILKENIEKIIYLKQKTNILPTVILSGKIESSVLQEIPILTIRPIGINLLHSSTANLLSSASSVVVQESQSGGGSLNFRGMEASRLLLVLDDITLNNAIFRSGHLQISSSINPFFIESISLLSGPASVVYGNGSMGGALIFNTILPEKKKMIRFHQQFESSSNAVITNLHANYYSKKTYHMTAFSIKSEGNLTMGNNRLHRYLNWGKESTNENEQLYTKYAKFDFIHKSNYMINKKNALLINTQYSTTTNIFRFDKMNDLKNDTAKYMNWYYGPQNRFLQSVKYTLKSKTNLFDKIKTSLAFQNIEESRHTQLTGSETINNRSENVRIYDLNLDFNKKICNLEFTYGVGSRFQKIFSRADLSDDNSTYYNTTRYPENGSEIKEFFTYAQINFPIKKKINLVIGSRLNNSELCARFNNITFNFEDVKNNNTSFVKSILISYNLSNTINITSSYYGGFRNPNIDDMGKIFSKDDINVVVPNTNLEPEFANNLELSVNCDFTPLKLQLQFFNTEILNVINREYGDINGVDSMLYDGVMMRIQMNQNIKSATIYGSNIKLDFNLYEKILISASCNFIIGETSDKKPLAHIPPVTAKISFNYRLKTHIFDFYTNYNGWKLAKYYDEGGVDNLEEATSDGNPSWYTLNLAYKTKIDENLGLTLAIKNILDAHYKTFGSGLSASGRNYIVAIHCSF